MSKAASSQIKSEEKALPKAPSLKAASLKAPSLKVTSLEVISLEPVCNFMAGSDFTAVILRSLVENNKTLFQIVLAHPMPDHSVIVASHDDDLDIIADWRFIGARLNLPLFTLSLTGCLEKFTEYGVDTTVLRRFGSPLSNRRTRFAHRRKMGKTG